MIITNVYMCLNVCTQFRPIKKILYIAFMLIVIFIYGCSLKLWVYVIIYLTLVILVYHMLIHTSKIMKEF